MTILNTPNPSIAHRNSGLIFLRRRYGNNYAELIDHPAAAIQAVRERKEEKRDIKLIRKLFYTLTNLMDDFDLDPEQRKLVYRGFANPLPVLPEGEGSLTFDTADENVKSDSANGSAKRRRLSA